MMKGFKEIDIQGTIYTVPEWVKWVSKDRFCNYYSLWETEPYRNACSHYCASGCRDTQVMTEAAYDSVPYEKSYVFKVS